MKAFLYKAYAALVLLIAYFPMHIEEQTRELARTYRNWKPRNTWKRSHYRWMAYWKVNIKD